VTTPGPGVFGPDDLDGLCAHLDAHGYATLRGAIDDELLAAAEAELVRAQEQLVVGELGGRHATAILDDLQSGQTSRCGPDWWSVCQPMRE